MILGLDVSTSCVGFSVLSPSGEIKKLTFQDLKREENFFYKADKIESFLYSLRVVDKFDIKNIYIESALHMFQMGKSSSHTISTLMKFNGIVSWLCYNEFPEASIEYVSAASARKLCGIKIEKGKKAKQCIMEHLIKTEPKFVDIVRYKKTGPIKDEYYDVADSYIMARAGFLTMNKKSSI